MILDDQQRQRRSEWSRSATVSKLPPLYPSTKKRQQQPTQVSSRPNRNTRSLAENKEATNKTTTTTTTTVTAKVQQRRFKNPEQQDLMERAKENIRKRRHHLATSPSRARPSTQRAKSTPNVKTANTKTDNNRQRRSSAPEQMISQKMQKRAAVAQDMSDLTTKSDPARQPHKRQTGGTKRRPSGTRYESLDTIKSSLNQRPHRNPTGSASHPPEGRYGSLQKIESMLNQHQVARNKNLPTRPVPLDRTTSVRRPKTYTRPSPTSTATDRTQKQRSPAAAV